MKWFWISGDATIGMHVQAKDKDEAIEIAETHNAYTNKDNVDIFSIGEVKVDFCKDLKGGA